MGLANISIVGNVVRPPSQTALANGSIKTTLVVAVNTFKKGAPDNQAAEFYRVDVWGKLAEIAYRFIGKGQQVTAVGRFSIDRWTDREGKERATGVVNATEISLPPKRAALDEQEPAQEGHSSHGMSPNPVFAAPPASAATPPTGTAGFAGSGGASTGGSDAAGGTNSINGASSSRSAAAGGTNSINGASSSRSDAAGGTNGINDSAGFNSDNRVDSGFTGTKGGNGMSSTGSDSAGSSSASSAPANSDAANRGSLRTPPPSAGAPYGVEADFDPFSEAEEDAATAEMYKHALSGKALSDAEADELFGAA